ncbi:hypothetical protein V2E29_04785 [Streptomyces diastatochromogenes]|uniref:hypothetical protein n=1 Tax=Streptomyces diastatochromogenes TaxID=42236 RepID=UPI002F26355D
MSHQTARETRLLQALRRAPVETVSTGMVRRWYTQWGLGPQRSTARRDLQHLAARGLLIETGPENDREYRLNQAAAR